MILTWFLGLWTAAAMDSTAPIAPATPAAHAVPTVAPEPCRSFLWQLGLGAQFPDFPQRSRFRADAKRIMNADTLTELQAYQSSEVAPTVSLEAAWQWRQSFRLALEGQWLMWWNQASAYRSDSLKDTSCDWSFTAQTWRVGLGPDLLIPTNLLSLQNLGPLAIEARGWLVRSSLEGRGKSQGWGFGWSAGISAYAMSTSHLKWGGRIRWHQETVHGDGSWSDLLEAGSGASGKPRWQTGGLEISFMGAFQLDRF